MRVQYIASATVIVEQAGKRVLCDPWLTDGIYHGSWFHYPPLNVSPEDFSDVDGIYISHIHPDHLDTATLECLPRSLPIWIHEYDEKFVLRTLKGLGFEQVIEIPHGQKIDISSDFSLEILAADNCDPRLCGKFIGCAPLQSPNRSAQIDSLAVFHGGGQTVVNVNDCPYALAAEVCDRIIERYGTIDLLMVGYSGAGPFPQCFDNLDLDCKLHQGAKKRLQFLHQAVQYLKHFQPSHFLPFAGQYTLGGRLAGLNPLRGVPEQEELPALFAPLLAEHRLPSQMVQLNSGEAFDLDLNCATAPFIPPISSEREEYVNTVLRPKRYTYEEKFHIPEENRIDLTPHLREAQLRMLRHQDRNGNYRSNWKFYLDTAQESLYSVPLDGTPVSSVDRGSEQEPFVRITLDYSLLVMVLERKAHWNNLEIGSHLRFYRQPDQFDRAVYHFLSYLHA